MQKTALITGASSGLGAETAKFFLEQGYVVYGTSRSTKPDNHLGINWLQLDLCDHKSIAICCDRIKTLFPTNLTIVHNAGIGSLGAALDFSAEDYLALFKSNFFGITQFNYLLKEEIVKHKISLIFISSLAGTYGLNYRAAYVASKHAIEGYVKSMRMELMQHGIAISIVAPGDVKTNIADSRTCIEPSMEAVWYKEYHQVVKVINSEVGKGIEARTVAQKVFKVSQLSNPTYKYIVAPRLQKFSYYLQNIIPYQIFEKLIINHYNK